MDEPIVSIIIASHNRIKDIRRCLESILKVDFDNFEAIVVLSGYEPATIAEIETFVGREQRIKLEISPILAKSSKLNRGLEIARGTYLVFTDDDCKVDKNWLSSCNSWFSKNEKMIAGRVVPAEKGYCTAIRDSSKPRIFKKSIKNLLFPWFIGSGSNLIIKKELFQQLGKFDENFGPGAASKSGDDLEFIYRMLLRGEKIVYEPECVVYHFPCRNYQEYRSKRKNYYFGSGYLARKKYRQNRIALLMASIRLFHSCLFIILNLFCFKLKEANACFNEAKAITEGWKKGAS